MTDDQQPIFRILTDDIVEADELGTHQQIADSIARLIESGQDGRAIALTGPWGSGKSSVIGMLNKKLRTKTRLFVFDAWAHERDPLHRSFLEMLIDFLSDISWIAGTDWKETKDRLARRLETTKITNFRRPTKLGYVLSILLLLVPVGVAVLNEKPWKDQNPGLILIGLILTLLPFVVGFLSLLVSFIVPKKYKHQFRYVLATDSTQDIHSDTYKTVDPTTIEFQAEFRKLMEIALKQNDRRLAIVIDNLDRLDAENAIAMWTTMKTFIDPACHRRQDWTNRVWLIVPIDPSASMRLWDGEGQKYTPQISELASSFVDKTFQVSFHVPPPVLSDWDDFFKKKLSEALPKVTEKDQPHEVYRIFRSRRYSGTAAPTPRNIKTFINRVGALYLQWHGKLDLRTLALYASIESEGRIVERLQSNDATLIAPFSPELVGEDIFLSLAAIHFGVPKDKAAHVLLGSKVEAIVRNQNAKDLSLMKTLTGGYQVFEETVESECLDWVREKPTIISWVANQLDAVVAGNHSSIATWGHLCRGASAVKTWRSLDLETGLGIGKLMEHRSSIDFTRQMLLSVSNTGPIQIPSSKAEADLQLPNSGVKIDVLPWLEGCHAVLRKAEAMHGSQPIEEYFCCPGTAFVFLAIMREAVIKDQFASIIHYLSPSADLSEVMSGIGTVISDGAFSETDRSVVNSLVGMNLDCPWQELIDIAAERLRVPESLDGPEVSALLGTLIDLSSEVQAATSALGELADGHYYFLLLYTAHNEEHPRAVALCLYMIMKLGAVAVTAQSQKLAAAMQFYDGVKSTPKQIGYALEELANLLVGQHACYLIFDVLEKDEGFEPLAYAIIKQLSTRDNLTAIVTAQEFVKHENDFYYALGARSEEYQTVVGEYVRNADLIQFLLSGEFDSDLASLYRAAYLSPNADQEHFGKWLVDGLRSVNDAQWTKELKTGYENLYDLVLALIDKKVAIGLGIPFRQALSDYRDRALIGKQPKAQLSQNWQQLLLAMDENLMKTFVLDTIDKIIDSSTTCGPIIALFGPALLNCQLLARKKDDLVQKGFGKFSGENRTDDLRWFADVIKKCPDVVRKCTDENLETLKQEVSHLLGMQELQEDKREILTQIAQGIGISLPTTEEEKRESET